VKRTTSLRIGAAAVASAAILVTAGCAGGSGEESGPVTLEYWAWAPGIEDVVAVWNENNPDIQVNVVEAAGADDMVAKLLAAQRAGEGPDLAQAEYQKLPNLVVSDVAMDISEYADQFTGDYTEGALSLVTVGEGIYAVPQDTGPMIFMYRKDIFDANGWAPPTTWDEYAALAATVKTTLPGSFLGGYPDDASTMAAYAQPLGAQWWATEGDAWKVGVDDTETQRVVNFWQPLVEEGLVDTTHFFTPEWGTMMNDGTLLSWTAGAWAPASAFSVAPDTAGLWAAAEMPTWDGESETGFMGGSSVMVTQNSEHPEEAVKFLQWLNGSEEGGSGLIDIGLFPASSAGQAELAGRPVPDLVSGQSDFWDLAVDIAGNSATFTWGPNVQVAFDAWSDGVKAAAQNGGSFADVLSAAQSAVIADLESSGFTVAD
jgi:multiple sugar transport system substrate-binding protein